MKVSDIHIKASVTSPESITLNLMKEFQTLEYTQEKRDKNILLTAEKRSMLEAKAYEYRNNLD